MEVTIWLVSINNTAHISDGELSDPLSNGVNRGLTLVRLF